MYNIHSYILIFIRDLFGCCCSFIAILLIIVIFKQAWIKLWVMWLAAQLYTSSRTSVPVLKSVFVRNDFFGQLYRYRGSILEIDRQEVVETKLDWLCRSRLQNAILQTHSTKISRIRNYVNRRLVMSLSHEPQWYGYGIA